MISESDRQRRTTTAVPSAAALGGGSVVGRMLAQHRDATLRRERVHVSQALDAVAECRDAQRTQLMSAAAAVARCLDVEQAAQHAQVVKAANAIAAHQAVQRAQLAVVLESVRRFAVNLRVARRYASRRWQPRAGVATPRNRTRERRSTRRTSARGSPSRDPSEPEPPRLGRLARDLIGGRA